MVLGKTLNKNKNNLKNYKSQNDDIKKKNS